MKQTEILAEKQHVAGGKAKEIPRKSQSGAKTKNYRRDEKCLKC